jgi:hypothetical protein
MVRTHWQPPRGLLLTAIFTSTMAAQISVQIQPSTFDVAATGVHLVSLNDIGHTKTVEAILGEDREVLSPLLPYAVLVVNGSSRKLRALGIRFQWKNTEGHPRQNVLTLTAMSSENDPGQILPGAAHVFTPIGFVNQYLAMQPIKRKPFLQNSQIGTTSSASVQLAPGTNFASFAQQKLKDLKIAGGVNVYLEGVVYDDYTYVGSDRLFGPMQGYESKVHR